MLVEEYLVWPIVHPLFEKVFQLLVLTSFYFLGMKIGVIKFCNILEISYFELKHFYLSFYQFLGFEEPCSNMIY
jgi:hypothetical protein